jgi:YggT family protein
MDTEMDMVRRESRTDVVNTDAADDGTAYSGPPAVNVKSSGSASTTAHQTETYTSDPHAARREGTSRIQRAIYLVFGILEGLLAIRFFLALLGANRASGFTQFIYGITKPFLAPFVGLFGTARSGGNVLDVSPLVAIIIYALIAWVLVKAVGLVMGDSRHGVRTTSSQIDTRVR